MSEFCVSPTDLWLWVSIALAVLLLLTWGIGGSALLSKFSITFGVETRGAEDKGPSGASAVLLLILGLGVGAFVVFVVAMIVS